MGSLIEDVLVLSRVTRADMDRTDVNLSKIAREIIDDFQEVDPKREVDIGISDNVRARCDHRLIKLVLQNLLDNAWKFTSKARYRKPKSSSVVRIKTDKQSFL